MEQTQEVIGLGVLSHRVEKGEEWIWKDNRRWSAAAEEFSCGTLKTCWVKSHPDEGFLLVDWGRVLNHLLLVPLPAPLLSSTSWLLNPTLHSTIWNSPPYFGLKHVPVHEFGFPPDCISFLHPSFSSVHPTSLRTFFIQPLPRHLSVHQSYGESFLPWHLIYPGFLMKTGKKEVSRCQRNAEESWYEGGDMGMRGRPTLVDPRLCLLSCTFWS